MLPPLPLGAYPLGVLPLVPLQPLAGIAGGWVLREDLLDAHGTGSKLRKYASLLPAWQQLGIRQVLAIGGAYSNHLRLAATLLPPLGFGLQLFVRGEPTLKPEGNLAHLLAAVQQHQLPLQWVPRSQWAHVQSYVQARAQAQPSAFVLPEGGSVPLALPGALTLAVQLWQAVQQQALQPQHLVLDAGTGLMAAATWLGLRQLGYMGQIWVVSLAEPPEALAGVFRQWAHQVAPTWGPQVLLWPLPNIVRPVFAPRFGHVNAQVRAHQQVLSQLTGLGLDAVYNTKTLATWLHIRENLPQAPFVWVHSGGYFSMPK